MPFLNVMAVLQVALLVAIIIGLRNLRKEMANTLDDVLTAVQSESTVDDSIIALLNGIAQQLKDVLAGGLTPAQQAKVDAIFNSATANAAKVSAAVTANTPAAPTP